MNGKIISWIATGAACAGVIATGYFAGKNAIQAYKDVKCEEFKRRFENKKPLDLLYETDQEGKEAIEKSKLTTKEKVELTWKEFIPSVTAGGLTIAAIIFCQKYHVRNEATLLAAAVGSQRFLEAYERKVCERADPEIAEQIRKEVIGEIQEGLVEDIHQSFDDGYKMLCYDPYSRKFFRATQVELLNAEAEINKCLMNGGGISLKTYMSMFGVDCDITDEGWYMDDTYSWNSSYYGFYNAMVPYLREVNGREALIIAWSHDPFPCEEDFLYGEC
jgi:hypothetical protein